MIKLIAIGFMWLGITFSVTAYAAGFYILPSVTAALPTSDLPLTVTGCTNTVAPVTASGAALCQFNSPATITFTTTASTTCQLNVTGTDNTFAITAAGSTCTNQNTNPTNATPTVLIQGGFAQGGGGSGRTITITNNTSENPITVYMGFIGSYNAQGVDPICVFSTSNPDVCQFQVSRGTPVPITLNQSGQVSVAFTVGNLPWGACPTSLAELTLNGSGGDTIDVSFVNGINYHVNVVGSSSQTALIDTTTAAAPNYLGVIGIYPPGCDKCAFSSQPPTWPNCPGNTNASPVPNPSPLVCQGGTQSNPNTACQITRPQITDTYTVTFSDL